jgi:choline dehydrogenase-like flavoprotein
MTDSRHIAPGLRPARPAARRSGPGVQRTLAGAGLCAGAGRSTTRAHASAAARPAGVLAARLSEDPRVRSACSRPAADSSVLIHCPARPGADGQEPPQAQLGPGETVPQPGLNGRRGYQPRGKVLGGSSSINAMIYIRGQRPTTTTGPRRATRAGPATTCCRTSEGRAQRARRRRLHGTGGPLNVMDLRSPNPAVRAAFVEAGVQAGHPRTDDFNGPSRRAWAPTRSPTATASAAAPPRPT